MIIVVHDKNLKECKNKQLSDTLSAFFEKNVNLAHIKLISQFTMVL